MGKTPAVVSSTDYGTGEWSPTIKCSWQTAPPATPSTAEATSDMQYILSFTSGNTLNPAISKLLSQLVELWTEIRAVKDQIDFVNLSRRKSQHTRSRSRTERGSKNLRPEGYMFTSLEAQFRSHQMHKTIALQRMRMALFHPFHDACSCPKYENNVAYKYTV